jgi:hypothetical protein
MKMIIIQGHGSCQHVHTTVLNMQLATTAIATESAVAAILFNSLGQFRRLVSQTT